MWQQPEQDNTTHWVKGPCDITFRLTDLSLCTQVNSSRQAMSLGKGEHPVACDSYPSIYQWGRGLAGARPEKEEWSHGFNHTGAGADRSFRGTVAHSGLGQVGVEVTDTAPEGVLTGLKLY